MQPPSAKPLRAETRHDVDRVTRLYETGEVAHLVLNFGEYKGASLLQVAQTDPDYVRQLALIAQRPHVRAAARQLVVAHEEVRRRTKVIGRFPGETSCLSLRWAVLDVFIGGARGLGLSDLKYRQTVQLKISSGARCRDGRIVRRWRPRGSN